MRTDLDWVRAQYLHYSKDESMFACRAGLSLCKYLALTPIRLRLAGAPVRTVKMCHPS